jgi:hypothetical protein
MRLRAFARAWEDDKRPAQDGELVQRGAMHDWVTRIKQRQAESALADVRALFNKT